MTVKLMYNKSTANTINKSLEDVTNIEGFLRNSCSVTDISFTTERDTGQLQMTFNYMYIPEFKRYYFLTGCTAITTQLALITGHVDVLTTYKEYILASTAVIRRQEGLYNLYLDDGVFKAYQNPKIKQLAFPNKFTNENWVFAISGNSE